MNAFKYGCSVDGENFCPRPSDLQPDEESCRGSSSTRSFPLSGGRLVMCRNSAMRSGRFPKGAML